MSSRGIVATSQPLAAQAATGFSVHLYAMVGIPVSTSHAVVGAVIGIGLLRGIRAVGRRKIAEISIGWIVTPAVSCAMCLLLCWIFVR